MYPDLAAARAALAQATAAGRAMTLEGWIAGTPLSLSLLCTATGCEVLSVNRQHVAPNTAGQVVYTGVTPLAEPVGPAHTALARDVCRALPGLRGFVGIDVVRSGDGRLHVIEVNPRLTCAYAGLSRHLGRNLAAEVLADHDTQPAPPMPDPTPAEAGQ